MQTGITEQQQPMSGLCLMYKSLMFNRTSSHVQSLKDLKIRQSRVWKPVRY
jgi:hypothetical protein